MDLNTIKSINQSALRAAKEAEGESGVGDNQMTMYLVAVAVAVVAYFLMHCYKPYFVMMTDADGQTKFDQTRAVIASVVVGGLVLLGYNMMNKE